MARVLLGLTFSMLVLTARPQWVWSDVDDVKGDNPKIEGYRLSDWLDMLKKDKDDKHRQLALLAMDVEALKLGKASPAVASKLRRIVIPAAAMALKEDTSIPVRKGAAQHLGRMAVYLNDLRNDPKYEEMKRAIREDFRIAFEALMEAAHNDKAAQVRAAAASSLGKAGSSLILDTSADREVKAAVSVLMGLLKDKQQEPREAAAEALARLGVGASGAIPELLEAAKDKTAERFFRIHAIFALGRVTGKENSESVVPALAEILNDSKSPAELQKNRCRINRVCLPGDSKTRGRYRGGDPGGRARAPSGPQR